MIVLFIGFVFLLIGLGVFVNGLVAVFKVRRQVAESVKTVGTVIGFGQKAGQSGYIYCPQVAFADAAGRKFRFESEVGSQPPGFTVGQPVRIVYRQKDPNIAEIDSLTNLWFVPGCLSVFGLGFIGLGSVLFMAGVFILLKT